jgi:hypothetical protein
MNIKYTLMVYSLQYCNHHKFLNPLKVEKLIPVLLGLVLINGHAENLVSYYERFEISELITSSHMTLFTVLQKCLYIRHHVIHLNKVREKTKNLKDKTGFIFLSIMAAITM